MDLPVKLGDAQEFLMLVPSPLAERVAEDERLVVAAYRFRRGLGIRARRALASRIEHEVTAALHIVRPGTVPARCLGPVYTGWRAVWSVR